MRIPGEIDFWTANGRHHLKGRRPQERRHSICFFQAIDMGVPEPLPGGGKGRSYFLKLAHADTPDSPACLEVERHVLRQPTVVACSAIAPAIVGGEGEWEGLPFVVKRFVYGRTLAEALSDRAEMLPEQVAGLLAAMAAAAETCHQAGYCVADWSPGNINWDEEMLLDLSGSVPLGETVRYARAESPDAGHEATPAVDVRGICLLAVDVYREEALRARQEGATTYAGMLAALTATRPRACPRGLWDVILAGLARPTGRLATAHGLQEALLAWPSARATAPAPRATPSKHRSWLGRLRRSGS